MYNVIFVEKDDQGRISIDESTFQKYLKEAYDTGVEDGKILAKKDTITVPSWINNGGTIKDYGIHYGTGQRGIDFDQTKITCNTSDAR